MIKKLFWVCTLFILAMGAKAQIGAGFLYSSVHPNLVINYNSSQQFWGEARLSMDVDAVDFSPELLGAYNFISSKEVDVYGAIGGRFNLLPGLVLASGLNAFPLEERNFGFTFEAALMVGMGTVPIQNIFRGSFGFRYLFNN